MNYCKTTRAIENTNHLMNEISYEYRFNKNNGIVVDFV